LPIKDINQIYVAGLLHDIGMVYIPEKITKKTEQLTEEEMDFIKKHPLISEKIISKYSALKDLMPIIRHHHEAMDGSGYPDGIKGNDIPVGSRIIGIVNNYDTMTTGSFKGQPMNPEDALDKISKKAGHQFDETLTKGFIDFIRSSNGKNIAEEPEVTVQNTTPVPEPEKTYTIKDIIEKIIFRFKKGAIDLPVLPKVVHEIQKVMSSPSTSVNELATIIERDAVISVRLISVANSVIYRGAEKILTVRHAIPRIGAKETQSIVATIANKALYEVKDPYFKSVMEKLWMHSLATALSAKAIARILMLGDNERYYFMGLIHDIGKVLLIKAMGEIHLRNESIEIDELMEGVREFHTNFGSTILRKWGFSEKYARVSLLHEGPRFKKGIDKEILVINLAGNIAKKIGYGVTSNPDDIDIISLESVGLLGIDVDNIDTIMDSIKDIMQEVSGIFK
jgi:HD-GYP domain-containing protein (c-di-GMP phosphodiesterase class II)